MQATLRWPCTRDRAFSKLIVDQAFKVCLDPLHSWVNAELLERRR